MSQTTEEVKAEVVESTAENNDDQVVVETTEEQVNDDKKVNEEPKEKEDGDDVEEDEKEVVEEPKEQVEKKQEEEPKKETSKTNNQEDDSEGEEVKYESWELPYKVHISNTAPVVDVKNQAVKFDGCVLRRPGFEKNILGSNFEDVRTLYDSFQYSVKKFGDNNCLGKRTVDENGKAGSFVFESFKKTNENVRNLAAGFIKLGLKPKAHVGIYSKNRVEWQIASEACNTQSMIVISLYDSLGAESSLYIVNHGEIEALCCSKDCLNKVKELASEAKFMKFVVSFDPVTEDEKKEFKEHNVDLLTIEEVQKLGVENPVDDTPPKPDDLTTIMYTSGTTGVPKGVMITHRNMVAAVSSVKLALTVQLSPEDVFLSYLPLAHIFERAAEAAFLQFGMSIGYWRGDIKEIGSDFEALKPTIITGVPRVYDKFYDNINDKLQNGSGISKFLLNKALAAKRAAQKSEKKTPWWDWLVFNKIRAKVGGRVKMMISGGAPLRPEVQELLRVAFDCQFIQGYGLTETCAGGTVQLGTDMLNGVAGCIIPSAEIKLETVEEMNYINTDDPPRGEVCIRGPHVSIGYYKQPEKTAEVFEKNGWFHTGDVGQLNPDGTISIIDRIKNIFKLAQGEYVAVENLELKLNVANYILKIWLYGDSLKSSLVGVCLVDEPALKVLAKEQGIAYKTIEELCENKTIVSLVTKEVARVSKEAKFKGYEIPRAVHLIKDDFDKFDALTPTMKIKRNVMKETFQKQIDEMYAQIQKQESSKK